MDTEMRKRTKKEIHEDEELGRLVYIWTFGDDAGFELGEEPQMAQYTTTKDLEDG
jgi:hypothetical protein